MSIRVMTHTCECKHECPEFVSCVAFQGQVGLAISLLTEASVAEVAEFILNNRGAVTFNANRNALQFLGCREGEIPAHVPLGAESIVRLALLFGSPAS